MHWGLLRREVFLILWIILAPGLAAYLFGIPRLPHDYKRQVIGAGRKIAGVVALFFAAYLFPGVLPATGNLNLLSGFPPPLYYSIYDHAADDQRLEANIINDYQRAVALSDSLKQPLLIDFTGWSCVNCRKMEENIWSQPEVSRNVTSLFRYT